MPSPTTTSNLLSEHSAGHGLDKCESKDARMITLRLSSCQRVWTCERMILAVETRASTLNGLPRNVVETRRRLARLYPEDHSTPS
jgi:hypothetical protein